MSNKAYDNFKNGLFRVVVELFGAPCVPRNLAMDFTNKICCLIQKLLSDLDSVLDCSKDKISIIKFKNDFSLLCEKGWISSEYNLIKALKAKNVFIEPREIILKKEIEIKDQSGGTIVNEVTYKMIEMDIVQSIKAFLAVPGMVDAIIERVKEINKSKKLCHFIKGELWQTIISRFPKSDDILYIPLFVFIDAYVPLNSLSKHAQAYKVTFKIL